MRREIFFAFVFVTLSIGSAAAQRKDLGEQMNVFLAQAAEFGFSGSALVAVDDKILVHKGFGLADRDRGIPMKPDDVFDIGSITKQFTAAAIMKLEMQGKLKTEDLISKYLEGVPADKAEITLHQALTHTAGFINYSGGDYEVSERDETIKRILAAPLTHKPGTRYAYSNSGYSVLAAIVEKVSGQSYESFLSEQLFKPAGITKTGYVLPKFDKASLPRAYPNGEHKGTPLDHKWSPNGPYWNLFGNGGILSTAGDLYKWYQALQGEKILSAAAKKKMFTPALENYAYGWSIEQTPQGRLINHNGASDNGFNAVVGFFPEKRIFGTVLSSSGTYFGTGIYADVVMNRLARMLAGDEFTPLPAMNFIKADPSALSKFTGRYRLENGSEFAITLVDGRLALSPSGQAAIAAIGQFPDASLNELSAANEKAAPVVEGIFKKDFAPFKNNVTDEGTYERFKGVLEQRIASWSSSDGTLKSYRVLGTGLTWWVDEKVPATFVELQFEKRSRLFRLHWRDGKIYAIGGGGIASPISVPMRPASPTDFVGWHIVTSRSMNVRFTPDGRTMTISAGEKTASATKVG